MRKVTIDDANRPASSLRAPVNKTSNFYASSDAKLYVELTDETGHS